MNQSIKQELSAMFSTTSAKSSGAVAKRVKSDKREFSLYYGQDANTLTKIAAKLKPICYVMERYNSVIEGETSNEEAVAIITEEIKRLNNGSYIVD